MESLAGQRVAFTGELASMTRQEASRLVRTHGGRALGRISRAVTILVVGQEGWPLRGDGRLSIKLKRARALQQRGHGIHILAEGEFLARLGRGDQLDSVRRLCTTAEVSRLLEIPGSLIRRWLRAGLIEPAEARDGVSYFDFFQVAALRTLWSLTRKGVSTARLRRSLASLRAWLNEPLTHLVTLDQANEVLVRLDKGELADARGQLHLDFAPPDTERDAVVELNPQSAWDWFQQGCEEEEAGRLREAAEAYRQALLVGGPDADASFNLANVLFELGDAARAAERLWQVVELEPTYAEAWNNLGVVLASLGARQDGLAAFERAIRLQPAYADAHYNLADELDRAGRRREALPHWKLFLQSETHGPRADFARSRS
jgi:tetratricopeptide (TPR) repeat protein